MLGSDVVVLLSRPCVVGNCVVTREGLYTQISLFLLAALVVNALLGIWTYHGVELSADLCIPK